MPVANAEPSRTTSRITPAKGSRSDAYISLSVFVLSFLYLCLFRRYTWIDPDEGIILQGAQRILDGQVLYRDFFSFFTPGSYYLLALLFRVFGDSFVVARTALALIGAGFAPITYLLSRRACSREVSLLVTGLMTASTVPMRFVILHNWDSTLLVCLSVYSAMRWLESQNSGWAFATGSFVSLTGLFEQSKGAGLLLGIGVGLAINVFADRERRLLGRTKIISVLTGLVWPLAVTAIYFTSQHALRAMLDGWFWPLHHYSTANRVPYGYSNLTAHSWQTLFATGSLGERLLRLLVFSPSLWLPALPMLGVGVLFWLVFQLGKRRPMGKEWSYYVLASASITGLLVSIIIVRPDYEHFVFLNPIFFLGFAWLLNSHNLRSLAVRRFALIVGFCLALSLVTMSGALLIRTRIDNRIYTRRGELRAKDKDEVIDYIQAHVAPGQPILIYPYQSTYYYLTGTYSISRYDYFQPGMHTPQQASEIISDLAAHPATPVLYDPAFAKHAEASWPNTPTAALSADPVAEYIASEYHNCTTLNSALGWQFQFMIRRDLMCP